MRHAIQGRIRECRGITPGGSRKYGPVRLVSFPPALNGGVNPPSGHFYTNGVRYVISSTSSVTVGAAPHVVRVIVGRCHVGQSNRAVIRYFISRLKRGYRTWAGMPRDERKQWLRWVVAAHAENRGLYNYVMGGLK